MPQPTNPRTTLRKKIPLVLTEGPLHSRYIVGRGTEGRTRRPMRAGNAYGAFGGGLPGRTAASVKNNLATYLVCFAAAYAISHSRSRECLS
jgi:hypothetical protein